ncbi:diaminopimelate epimerase [Pontibacter sp. G13]|uniref:diaminopimelate epimerase n=1 Tax=Pontibacter sp. G13 TaxID=3074898 RepID=UPI002889AF9C|nr:diaminopimelate epimerase [Pontibacter sp. G13]WNJ17246.1 diaminopimelate epimerase [Pontibacter sp. G13]
MAAWQLNFWKYQGTGNDFIMIDCMEESWDEVLSEAHVEWLCDRKFGIGADGLIMLAPSDEADFRMVYFNSDGRESTMCGNGGRCLVAFAHHRGVIADTCVFDAIDGLHAANVEEGWVSLEMIQPEGLKQLSEHADWLDTGSPHYVSFVLSSVSELDIPTVGAAVRHDPQFAEIGGTNANFVNILAPNQLKVRTFERGVEDETLSCGTGVTAAAYSYLNRQGSPEDETEEVQLEVEGGQLQVVVQNRGTEAEQVWLQGPAERVFKGEITVPKELQHNE